MNYSRVFVIHWMTNPSVAATSSSMDLLDLPFNRLIGLVRSDRPGALLMLPDDVRYTNHLGTVHAGALLALAENSSGELLQREFPALPFAVLPVVRRVEAKFRNPARGAVHARAELPAARREEFLGELIRRGRARLEVPVRVEDAAGVPVLAATIEWFIARRE